DKLFRDLTGKSHPLPSGGGGRRPGEAKVYCPSILKPVASIPAETKVALLRKAYEAAQGPFVRQVSISYAETSKHVRVFTSAGDATEEWRTLVTFSLTVVAEKDGLLQ